MINFDKGRAKKTPAQARAIVNKKGELLDLAPLPGAVWGREAELSPEDTAVWQETVDRLQEMLREEPEYQALFGFLMAGFPQAEIAKRLGKSAKQLSRMVARLNSLANIAACLKRPKTSL